MVKEVSENKTSTANEKRQESSKIDNVPNLYLLKKRALLDKKNAMMNAVEQQMVQNHKQNAASGDKSSSVHQ